MANATGRPGPGGYDLRPTWQQRSLSPRLRPAQSSPTQSSPTQSSPVPSSPTQNSPTQTSRSAPGLDKRFRLTPGTREGHGAMRRRATLRQEWERPRRGVAKGGARGGVREAPPILATCSNRVRLSHAFLLGPAPTPGLLPTPPPKPSFGLWKMYCAGTEPRGGGGGGHRRDP